VSGEPFVRGDRVELVEVDDGYARFGLAPGMRGTVMLTDSLSTIHIHWDRGIFYGIVVGTEHFIRPIDEESGGPGEGITRT